MSNDYWVRRYLKDKAAAINRAENYLYKQQKNLYSAAENEIQQEIEKLYKRFADSENISLTEAKRKISAADFNKIDWEGMLQEEKYLRKQMKEELPESLADMLSQQHQELDASLKLYSKRGSISYLELRQLEIEKKLVRLYDEQQLNIYDYLSSEYEDVYYKSIFNTQQRIGIGKDFVRPNEKAIEKAILNRQDKRNFSRSTYAACNKFSQDIKEHLVIGLIKGENLDKMASRIHKRMGVANSAAKTLVRTETAYIFETATMEGYQESGIEWYEFLATLDNKTSEICRSLDGKHFKVKDAVPGVNYPPMHPNCRSTTVCWFPDEQEKKNRTKRIAKSENGKYYEVPADMTYEQWRRKNEIREYRYIGNWKLIDSFKKAVYTNNVVKSTSKKVQKALKPVTFKYRSSYECAYDPITDTIYLGGDIREKYIKHEIGHAIEDKLFNPDKVREMKKKIVIGKTIADIKIRKGETSTGEIKNVFILESDDLVDIYQGRIYANSIEECLDSEGNIDIDKMYEFVSVGYQYYMDHPKVMRKRFNDMYHLVRESVE